MFFSDLGMTRSYAQGAIPRQVSEVHCRRRQNPRRVSNVLLREKWRKRVGVEPTGDRIACRPPVLKTGTITGPHALPQVNEGDTHRPRIQIDIVRIVSSPCNRGRAVRTSQSSWAG